jgi:hypothetical protein
MAASLNIMRSSCRRSWHFSAPDAHTTIGMAMFSRRLCRERPRYVAATDANVSIDAVVPSPRIRVWLLIARVRLSPFMRFWIETSSVNILTNRPIASRPAVIVHMLQRAQRNALSR